MQIYLLEFTEISKNIANPYHYVIIISMLSILTALGVFTSRTLRCVFENKKVHLK